MHIGGNFGVISSCFSPQISARMMNSSSLNLMLLCFTCSQIREALTKWLWWASSTSTIITNCRSPSFSTPSYCSSYSSSYSSSSNSSSYSSSSCIQPSGCSPCESYPSSNNPYNKPCKCTPCKFSPSCNNPYDCSTFWTNILSNNYS